MCLPLGCSPAEPYPDSRNPSVHFTIPLPTYAKPAEPYDLDANGDGKQEQVILYRFDLSPGIVPHGAPTKAIVYQLDDETPPNIRAYELFAPDRNYLCECECVPTACRCIPALQDVLSGLEGLELIVSDRCDGEIVGLTIFHWDAAGDGYQPKGHFLGHRIEIAQDQLIVEQRLSDRAQLARRETFNPTDNQTYYQPDSQSVLVSAEKHELVFPHGEPEDVALSPYCEKIVLAFYNHYTDTVAASAYFADGTWDGLGQCDTSLCGCAGPRSEITHVRVTGLQLEWESINKDRSLGPDQATVGATVICEHPGGMSDGETPVQWYLIRMGDRWQISSRE